MAHPKKNINPVLHDIKHPKEKPDAALQSFAADERAPLRRTAVVASLILAFSLAGYGLFYATPSSLSVFRGEQVVETEETVSGASIFQSIADFFGKSRGFVRASRKLVASAGELQERGFALAFDGGGEELIGILKDIHTNLSELDALGVDFSDQLTRFNLDAGGEALAVLGNVDVLEAGLGSFIAFLERPGERRIAVLFENHSEIRPSGGFVGSYADVVVEGGNVRSVRVDDIYYPDRRLEYDVVPPIQLQSITPGWGARDANWFFDYPASAEETLTLLEASEIYVHDGVEFDAAIALNANFVEDILAVTGPIEAPERGVTLTADNFLLEVRKDVEASRDADPTQNPKQILGIIMPTVIERLGDLNGGQRQLFLGAFLRGAQNKDIKFYFRDEGLQDFVAKLGFAGEVYALSEDFVGDYLAVVNANVAGGKSDIFVDQTITLNSEIDGDGGVENHLVITRRHFGEDETEPLYRARNQNFLKVFTVPGAELVSIKGATPKTVRPLVNYGSVGYAVSSLLEAVERTRQIIPEFDAETYMESGKKVFAAWFSTEAGETRILSLRYTGGTVPLQEAPYRFVFEKQSGVESALEYRVVAPEGYYWKESGAREYSYRNSKLPRRLILELTLVRE